MRSVVILMCSVSLLSGSCSPSDISGSSNIGDYSRRIATEGAGKDWLSYGGTYDEQRDSRLSAINRGNVSSLGVAWTQNLETARGVEATPIVVDGVMYVSSAWSVVHALDAKTGKVLWKYDPSVDKSVGVNACCDVVNRGVAVSEGLVFVGVIDGRLEALDAKTGRRRWSTLTVDPTRPYTITGAPRVVDDLVFIGNGGAELGVRGYLSAYGVKDGQLRWRFYTTPNPDKKRDNAASDDVFAKFANASWGDSGAWTKSGGGGTVWDSIIYDVVNDQIIFGVGNGSPWNHKQRDPSRKDNLFLSSIVAVDRKTGHYKWHFQTTPGDQWDYTATQSLIIADLPLGANGHTRRVVMQAPKNGFFYVLDAKSGKYLSGTQFARVNWAIGLDPNGRPIVAPEADYSLAPHLQLPGPLGAHNWHPMAFSNAEGLVFIPSQEIAQLYVDAGAGPSKPTKWRVGVDLAAGLTQLPSKQALRGLRASLKGSLVAWDPVAKRPRWTVKHDNAWNGGVLSTAGGLVFQGRLDGTIVAYDAKSGRALWQSSVNAGISAAPISYEVDGEQYIAVAAGSGSIFALLNGFAFDKTVTPELGRVVAFKLKGRGQIPPLSVSNIDRKPAAASFGTPQQKSRGLQLYSRNCMVCHGAFAISSGVLPDLRWSAVSGDRNAWRAVVLDGALSGNGMVSFKGTVSNEDAEAIRAYVVAEAHNGEKK